MESILLQAMKHQTIVSIYTNAMDPNSFSTGYVLGITDEWVLINSISPGGINDGIYLLPLEDIYQINIEGAYENKIKCLHHLKKQINLPSMQQDDLLLGILMFAKNNNALITCEIYRENEVYGFVEDIDKDTVFLKCYDCYGRFVSHSTLKAESITRAKCCSEYEISLKMLLLDSETKNCDSHYIFHGKST